MRISVMTYNVHSCIGTDGSVNTSRIAKVIEEHNADIVALQELDSGLMRTGLVDQAKILADMLEMNHHFLPSIQIGAGQYGNAVLSRHFIRLFHAGELPTLPERGIKEKRGAIWLKLDASSVEIDVFNTHLGLNRHERLAQATALTGPEWLRHPECRGPVILCGDLNVARHSGAYRMFTRALVDVRSTATWPSRFPFMRLDYIFVSPDIQTKNVRVVKDVLTRRASDHLPVLAILEVPSREDRQ
ncbi:MAG: endonuclease/exonuclease/phosphatase family protein [Chloroflexota bacterium]